MLALPTNDQVRAESACPRCDAAKGEPCIGTGVGKAKRYPKPNHQERVNKVKYDRRQRVTERSEKAC